MFSNGTEAEIFTEQWCEACAKYVPWYDGIDENLLCPIELAWHHAAWDEKFWPAEMVRNGLFYRCVGFQLREGVTMAESAEEPSDRRFRRGDRVMLATMSEHPRAVVVRVAKDDSWMDVVFLEWPYAHKRMQPKYFKLVSEPTGRLVWEE